MVSSLFATLLATALVSLSTANNEAGQAGWAVLLKRAGRYLRYSLTKRVIDRTPPRVQMMTLSSSASAATPSACLN